MAISPSLFNSYSIGVNPPPITQFVFNCTKEPKYVTQQLVEVHCEKNDIGQVYRCFVIDSYVESLKDIVRIICLGAAFSSAYFTALPVIFPSLRRKFMKSIKVIFFIFVFIIP